MLRATMALVVMLAIACGQNERWVYRYDGPRSADDVANSLVQGADGNIYAAGTSYGNGTGTDFTVVSLTPLGAERWVYRYNGPGNANDSANSICADSDGNIYAAGFSTGSETGPDFTVVSLTSSGSERWVYRFDQGSDWDEAFSIISGADGNIYAAGRSAGYGTNWNFVVISLTPSGAERWVYGYNPSNAWDEARSVVSGADGNIYAAGWSTYGKSVEHITVVSLTSLGSERWVYHYNDTASADNAANSIAAGADGNVYVAGLSYSSGSGYDFTVVSLTSLGDERWVYRYDGPESANDRANSIVAGVDGNIYAAGLSYVSESNYDFPVVSLTSAGSERWVYRYDGPENDNAIEHSLVADVDGNIYAAGRSGHYLTVVSLTPLGTRRWVYRYTDTGGGGCANSLFAGADGNIYAAGWCMGDTTWDDFTVISLNPTPGIAEGNPQPAGNAFGLAAGTIRNRDLAYTLKLPEPATVSLSLCDLQGRKLASWQVPAPKGTSQHTRNLLDLSSGVYFLRAGVPGKELRVSRKLIVAQ